MKAPLRHWLGVWLAFACLLACLPARADTALSVYKSFSGSVNFTGTEVTLRAYGNSSNVSNGPCLLVSNGTASATLSGIPSGATILSAQLYWAGSGGTVDKVVHMDTADVTASRTYQSSTIGGGNNYFSAAADVTTAVQKKGNNTYTFSGLSVSTGSPWCDVQGVVAGFALAVVYSAPSEPFRNLSIYEGFQYFRGNSLTINLSNFKVPDLSKVNTSGRIGHITWEGDSTLSGDGESLLYNTTELVDKMNPSGNQFNSQSNINGDYNSYGIDFDAYTLTASNNTIASGQSSATTTYKTGQDLVLLSAEIVAMPTVGNADLALSMTRNGDLTANASASYTISVANQGTDVEVGPVTVVDTLPSGLKYVSAAGSGWSCSSAAGSSGTTIVTCSHAGPLAASATMTALTLNVTSSANANYTNSATVSGQTGDSNAGNNTASNSYSMSSATYGYFASFTREPCTSGQVIVVLASDNGCHTFTGPVTAGATGTGATKIYITGVKTNSAGQYVASPISSSSTTVPVDFQVSCLPYSGSATYLGTTFDCKGGWQTVNLTVSGNQTTASNSPVFFYADVGRIVLSARYQGNALGSIAFISRPADIRVRDVVRAGDGFVDPATNGAGPGYTRTDTGFARAGDPFILRIGAWMASAGANGSQWAPSFGKEAAALKSVMDPNLLGMQFQLDQFATTSPQSTPVLPLTRTTTLADVDAVDGLVQDSFVINQDFAPSSSVAGAMEANVTYFEAGNLALTPALNDYLGTGLVGSVPADADLGTAARFAPGTRVIGRFYPDHFETNVVQKFDCLPAMGCPAIYDAAKAAWPVSGAVYTSQPFVFSVNALGLPQNGQPSPLALFQNVTGNANRGTVLVSAVTAPNATTARAGLTVKSALPVAAGAYDFPQMSGSAIMKLDPAFDAANRIPTGGWGAPAFFYLRASMNETRQAGGGTTQALTINSIAPTDAKAGTQYEDGLLAVNGRLQVANAMGSEALRLPVALTAQYWSGSAWLANTNDGDSLVAASAPVGTATLPLTCTRGLVASPANPAGSAYGNCASGAVTAANTAAIRLNGGRATLILQQQKLRGLNGTIDYLVSGGEAAAWLPATRARATFGLYKAPVIYLREVY